MAKNINELIINWYDKNKRDLPWRNTVDPYKIWLSEIILQQTRVEQGRSYYERFVLNFPTIEKLALAEEQQVLQLWQGLGYYSRARNLHKTAQIIQNECNSQFPTTYAEIIKLPGIGDYTASAISSFAFNEAQAVLDGNVFRVLSRIFNWSTPIDSTQGKKEFRQMAQEFLYKSDPAEHNQAIMELGALICTPKSPSCEICPVAQFCAGLKEKNIDILPVKSKKIKVRIRNLHFLHLNHGEDILIQKRIDKDIWQHLYQLPLIEIESQQGYDEIVHQVNEKYNILIENSIVSEPIQHLLSHQKLTIQFHRIDLQNKIKIDELEWVNQKDLKNYPFPKPLVDYLDIQD